MITTEVCVDTLRRLFGAASLRSNNRYMLPTPPHCGGRDNSGTAQCLSTT
jgi:hypothetical protein